MLPKINMRTLRTRHILIAALGLLIVCGGLVTVYANQLQTRTAGEYVFPFKITGPSTLVRGSSATITWSTSAENALRYPYEKIEYCTKRTFGTCTTLAVAVENRAGKAVVSVPASLPLGEGVLKLTARTSNRWLAYTTRAYREIVVKEGQDIQISPTPLLDAKNCPAGYELVPGTCPPSSLDYPNVNCPSVCERIKTSTPLPAQLSPIAPVASCANLQQRINAELLKVNYCSSAIDCSATSVLSRGEDGVHRCLDALPNYYHNKNANTSTLKQLGQQYAANQCPASPPGGCRGPREDESAQVACVQNKCVLTFSAK